MNPLTANHDLDGGHHTTTTTGRTATARNPHHHQDIQEPSSSQNNDSVDQIRSVRSNNSSSNTFKLFLQYLKGFSLLPSNSGYIVSSIDPMPRLFPRRKSKKKERRSTKSFRVKADLSQQLEPAPPQKESSHSQGTAVSDSSSQENNNVPYYRGGGYHSHVRKTYEERWSQEHVDLVLKSWKMTPRQADKLMQLKDLVKDVDHFLLNDPQQLVYFLLDERGDVDLAEKWFRKIAHDRAASPYHHDTLCETYALPDDYDHLPIFVLRGHDKDGDPINVTRTGAADIFGLYQRHGRDALIHHALYYQELLVRGAWHDDYETQRNKKVTQYTLIFDLHGLGMRHVKPTLLPVLALVSRIVQDSYPELVKRILIVRAPRVFTVIWGMVKHFFDAELRELMIFVSGEEHSQHAMEKYIDVDVLPHCIHPEGKDGRVARGYEHIVMDDGILTLPPEGTYTTPSHCREGRTKAEEEAYQDNVSARHPSIMERAMSDTDMGETLQTSNLRRDSSLRAKQNLKAGVVACRGKNLLGGRYSNPHNQIQIELSTTSGHNQHMVGLN